MSELFPPDADLNALSGLTDAEQEVPFPAIYESPYYTTFYKMLYRLLDVARRAGDLRAYKDGETTFGVRAGKFFDGDTLRTYGGANAQSLTDEATNYVYLTADGALTVNTTGFPIPSTTPHIRLAEIVVASGAYDHDDITDVRGTAFLTLSSGLTGADMAEASTFFQNTDLTGAEAETLSDGSNADALHSHVAKAFAKKASVSPVVRHTVPLRAADWATATGVTRSDSQTPSGATAEATSLKIVVNAAGDDGYTRVALGSPIDVTDAWVDCDFYLPLEGAEEDERRIRRILLSLRNDTSNKIERDIYSQSDAGDHLLAKHGRIRCTFPIGHIANADISGWLVTGAPDLSVIDEVQVHVFKYRGDSDHPDYGASGESVVATCYLTRFDIIEKPRCGVVCIDIDNGEKLQDGATYGNLQYAGLLEEHGLRATFAIIAGRVGIIGGGSEYLDTTDLRRLVRHGHALANHTYTHDPWIDNTVAANLSDARAGAAWLTANGFGGASQILITPGGGLLADDGEDYDTIIGEVCSHLRTTTPPNGAQQTDHPAQWPVMGIAVNTDSATVASMQERVQDVMLHGGVATFYGHGRDSGWTNFSAWLADADGEGNSLSDLVKAGTVVCATRDELPRIFGDARLAAEGLAPALRDAIPGLTITGADDGDGTGSASIQAKDAAGDDLAERLKIHVWIADAEFSEPDAQTDFSVSAGEQLYETEADADYTVISDSNGTVNMNIDAGGAKTVYVMAEVGGRVYSSGAINITA
jgi:hypothetical protein